MAFNPSPSLALEEVDAPITEKWGHIQVRNEKFSYICTIENFSLLDEANGKVLESPEFSVGANNDECKWNLKMYPKGKDSEYKEFFSVYLQLRSCNKSAAKCKFKFSILNAKKEQIHSKFADEVHKFEIMSRIGFGNFIQRELLLGESDLYLPKDTLTILCEGSILTDIVNTSGEGHHSKITVPECRLSEDLGKLIANENFSDVILEVGGHEIKAHKAILASRSDVFAAMFKHNLAENKSNRVTIGDIDHEVLEEMLRFLYTGKTSNLEKNAKDLYAAADKYALEKLKVMCEIVLLENLSIETAAETFILAYLHSSVQMKADTKNFIKTHITEIMKTKGWHNMLTSYSDLVAEIIQSLIKQ